MDLFCIWTFERGTGMFVFTIISHVYIQVELFFSLSTNDALLISQSHLRCEEDQIRFSFTSGTFRQRRPEKRVPEAHKTFGGLQRVAFSVRDISTDTDTPVMDEHQNEALIQRVPSQETVVNRGGYTFIYLFIVCLRCKVYETFFFIIIIMTAYIITLHQCVVVIII